MTLRAVPNNPLQRFGEEYKRIPAKKFPGTRLFPFVHERFADSAEIPFVSLRSACKSRQRAPANRASQRPTCPLEISSRSSKYPMNRHSNEAAGSSVPSRSKNEPTFSELVSARVT